MLGEIRDIETARAAIQAGLTGHLVISTIHSGSAAGVFTRLLDMDIEPYLVASSVTGVLAQRLLRRNCPQCAEPYEPDAALRAQFGIPDSSTAERATATSARSAIHHPAFQRGQGCEACQGLKYSGRRAAGELLQLNDAVTDLVLERARTQVIHQAAIASGMVTLHDDAIERAIAGETTLEEVKRVLPPVPNGPANFPRSKENRAGFTLLELVTAFFIFSLGLIGVISAYHYGLDKVRVMRNAAIAERAVQNEMEMIRGCPEDNLRRLEMLTAINVFLSEPAELEKLHNATPSVAVRRVDDGSPALREVTVSLRWTGEHGRLMKRSLTTLIADKNPSTGGAP
jgi:hypothetical protein